MYINTYFTKSSATCRVYACAVIKIRFNPLRYGTCKTCLHFCCAVV